MRLGQVEMYTEKHTINIKKRTFYTIFCTTEMTAWCIIE